MPTCTRCGRPLRNGVCPKGHPQRAARRRRRRFPLRKLLVPLLILALLAAGAYAALVWYPARSAEQVAVPASERYGEAQAAYLEAVDAFPAALDAETIPQTAQTVRDATAEARRELASAQSDLDASEPTQIPIIQGREPLPLAAKTRERMLGFYIGALELITDIESVAGFASELSATLPKLEDLRTAVGSPRSPADVDRVVAAARPVADQLVADVEALTPPVELSALHEELKAVAGRLRASLDELDQVGGQGAGPIITSLVTEIGRQLDSFRATVLATPEEARRAGLGPRIEELQRQQGRIAKGLGELRDTHGIPVTVPAAS